MPPQPDDPCPYCNGEGRYYVREPYPIPSEPQGYLEDCPYCDGTGERGGGQ